MSTSDRVHNYLSDECGRFALTMVAVMAVACIIYLLAIFLLGIEGEVIRDRYWRDMQPLFSGDFPTLEYPPFAIVFMAIPRVFLSGPIGYNIGYVIEVFVFMVLGLLLVSRIAQICGYSRKRSMLVYTALMLLMIEFVTDRFDVFPAILTLASLYLFMSGRRAWSFLILAIATMTKLYPAILFPVMFIHLVLEGDRRDASMGTIVFFGSSLIMAAVSFIIEPTSITGFIGYHSARPLQIESVEASLLYPFSVLGISDMWITSAFDPGSFGSDNLVGEVPDAVAGVLTPLMVVSILVSYLLYFMFARGSHGKAERDRLFISELLLSVMLFIVVGKVFSSQYLIWMIPFLTVLMMVSSRDDSKHLFVLMVVCEILTQAQFAYNAGYLGGGSNIDVFGMTMILVRNLFMILMLVMVVRGMILSSRRSFARGSIDDRRFSNP